jgi:hypothetical protein
MKGLKRPNGSNILAVILRKDIFVTGRVLAYSTIEDKLKHNSSVLQSHFVPRTFTTSTSFSLLSLPIVEFAYD